MVYDVARSFEEMRGSLLHPDPSSFHRYFETLRSKTLEPERLLMLAVLEEAIVCFQKYVDGRNARERRLFCGAEEWILADDCDWLFSFESICFYLSIDPSYVRDGLRRWKKREKVRAY